MKQGPTFPELMLELGRLINAKETPFVVIEAASRLAENPQELFWFIPNCNTAPRSRTPNLAPGLQPSDLLLEIMEAVRAAEWEKVLILFEKAGSFAPRHDDPPVVASMVAHR